MIRFTTRDDDSIRYQYNARSDIASEILLEPEVDDVRLDEFLHEFVVREGRIANA